MKKMKYVFLFLMLFVTVGCGKEVKESEEKKMTGKVSVEMTIKDYGVVELELDYDNAPITVDNFVKLAEDGFYDGLTFHRIAKDFVIQGGDPTGTGMGGSDTKIKGEFSSNGVENNISHERGVISMARSNDNNSASSQFFIVLKDSLFLDGDYAGFGHVTKGMDIIDKVVEEAKVEQDGESVAKENQPVIEKIRVKKDA